MSSLRRHQPQIVRSRTQNPRRITRDQLEKEQAHTEKQRIAEENHQPAIMTRQGLIDAGLLTPGK